MHQKILILDFGSQYTQLIARRVREVGVYCELHSNDVTDAFVRDFAPSGIILSGGPNSVYEEETPRAPDVVFSLGVPNPLSFGGRAAGFDPAHPGIAGVVRHPVLWALALWSLVHLGVNGDLAHVILFGSFAGFSLLGMRAIDRRMQARMDLGHWQVLAQNTSAWPFAALQAGRWRPRLRVGLWRLVLAFAVWAGVLTLHGPMIGMVATP